MVQSSSSHELLDRRAKKAHVTLKMYTPVHMRSYEHFQNLSKSGKRKLGRCAAGRKCTLGIFRFYSHGKYEKLVSIS